MSGAKRELLVERVRVGRTLLIGCLGVLVLAGCKVNIPLDPTDVEVTRASRDALPAEIVDMGETLVDYQIAGGLLRVSFSTKEDLYGIAKRYESNMTVTYDVCGDVDDTSPTALGGLFLGEFPLPSYVFGRESIASVDAREYYFFIRPNGLEIDPASKSGGGSSAMLPFEYDICAMVVGGSPAVTISSTELRLSNEVLGVAYAQ
ncbi:MAG: hypothetical protein AAF683_03785 [Pseudomonadota bacterium]